MQRLYCRLLRCVWFPTYQETVSVGCSKAEIDYRARISTVRIEEQYASFLQNNELTELGAMEFYYGIAVTQGSTLQTSNIGKTQNTAS